MKIDEKLVLISTPASEFERMLVESLLSDAGIGFSLRNAELQNLFGAGQIGGANLVTGPVQVLVAESDVELAQAILENTATSEEATETDSSFCPSCHAPIAGQHVCPECGLVLDPTRSPATPESESRTTADETPEELYRRYSKYSLIWAILWIAGIGSLLAIYFGAKALQIRSEIPTPENRQVLRPALGITLGVLGFVFWATMWYLSL